MANVSTKKIPSKGQVVIPENIAPPSLDEFDALIADAGKKGKQAGLKKSDIKNAIFKARRKKK